MGLHAGSQDSEPTVDALRADAAVGVLLGDLPGVGAARRKLDQVATAGVSDQLDHLGLGLPKEWILDDEWLRGQAAEEPGEPIEHLRVGGARCPRTDNLRGGR